MNTDVKLAVNSHFKANLSTSSLSTMNFFTMKPVYFKEIVPGEKVDIDMNARLRMMALNKPMFGNLTCKTRTFFVPYRLVFPHWNAFITDSREHNAKYTQVPTVPVYDFLIAFMNDATYVTKEVCTSASTVAYDFVVTVENEGTPVSFGNVFTKKGRRVNDIFKGLGYNLPWGFTYLPSQTASIYANTNTSLGNINLLSLMAYGKIVSDWFTMPAYQDKINTIGACIDTISTFGQTTANMISNIKTVMDLCVDLHYSDDIFVSAWDNPNSPNQNVTGGQNFFIQDVTNNATEGLSSSTGAVRSLNRDSGEQRYVPTNGTPALTFGLENNNSNNTAKNVTQYLLNALQKLSSYLRRNQIVGYRPLDRYLARYGKKLSSEQLLRSIVLGESNFDIFVDEVVSTSDTVSGTQGQSLGDLAGKGIGKAKGHIKFESDEFGVLITVCYIIPYVKYYQGLNPANLRFKVTDFYQPEFDALGAEPIPSNTVVNDCVNSYITASGFPVENTQYPNSQYIFGYAPRYYSYKTNPYALVSGDFAYNSRNVGYEQWHLFRKINNSTLGTAYAWKHNQAFTQGSVDADNYNRIFQVEDGENDGFIVGFDFNVDAYLPMKPLYDDYILNSDPDSEHSRDISMSVGGTRLS